MVLSDVWPMYRPPKTHSLFAGEFGAFVRPELESVRTVTGCEISEPEERPACELRQAASSGSSS